MSITSRIRWRNSKWKKGGKGKDRSLMGGLKKDAKTTADSDFRNESKIEGKLFQTKVRDITRKVQRKDVA